MSARDMADKLDAAAEAIRDAAKAISRVCDEHAHDMREGGAEAQLRSIAQRVSVLQFDLAVAASLACGRGQYTVYKVVDDAVVDATLNAYPRKEEFWK